MKWNNMPTVAESAGTGAREGIAATCTNPTASTSRGRCRLRAAKTQPPRKDEGTESPPLEEVEASRSSCTHQLRSPPETRSPAGGPVMHATASGKWLPLQPSDEAGEGEPAAAKAASGERAEMGRDKRLSAGLGHPRPLSG